MPQTWNCLPIVKALTQYKYAKAHDDKGNDPNFRQWLFSLPFKINVKGAFMSQAACCIVLLTIKTAGSDRQW